MADDSRAVKVTANDVSLKLTLTSKLLKKSFEDAVIAPFIKAYNKRAEVAVSKLDLLGVRIDEDQVLKDITVPASVVLLRNETVHAELTFRAPLDPSMELPSDPFQAPPQVGQSGLPSSTPIPNFPSANKEKLVDFQDDDRSEIERMKAERRAARLAREAAGDADGAGAAAEGAAAAMEEAAPEASSEPEALQLLGAAEKSVAFLEGEVTAIRGIISSAGGDFAEGMLVDASKRAASITAAVGKLQAGMDEISLGELDEDEVAPARARRKAVNAKIESELLPAARALPKEVKAALGAL